MSPRHRLVWEVVTVVLMTAGLVCAVLGVATATAVSGAAIAASTLALVRK